MCECARAFSLSPSLSSYTQAFTTTGRHSEKERRTRGDEIGAKRERARPPLYAFLSHTHNTPLPRRIFYPLPQTLSCLGIYIYLHILVPLFHTLPGARAGCVRKKIGRFFLALLLSRGSLRDICPRQNSENNVLPSGEQRSHCSLSLSLSLRAHDVYVAAARACGCLSRTTVPVFFNVRAREPL